MARTLTETLPVLCSQVPGPDRLDTLPSLIAASVRCVGRESEKTELVVGLLLLLKRPNKAQRKVIVDWTTVISGAKSGQAEGGASEERWTGRQVRVEENCERAANALPDPLGASRSL